MNATPRPAASRAEAAEAATHAAAQADLQSLYHWRAPVYDLELAAFEPLRRLAIVSLSLQPGQCVLDLGCGTGLSLGLLRDAVGAQGRVIGVEQCPAMAERARAKIQAHGKAWRHIEVLLTPAAQVEWPDDLAPADAALFHFTHDVLQSSAALDRSLAALRPGAQVVALGLCWAPPWQWASNAFVLGAALHSMSSLDGLACPWQGLAARLQQHRISRHWMDSIYLLQGQV